MVKKNVHISKDELEIVRDARFVKWFKEYVAERRDEIDLRILEISHGPGLLASGVYEEVNLLIENEEDEMQKDEDEEDDMEGDEDEEEEEVEDEDEETCCDDSDNNESQSFAYSERTIVKGKHSKPKPRATNASAIMSLPSNDSMFVDPSTQAQMQQVNDMPSEPPSLLATSAEQVDNEPSSHDSSRSTSIDLSASVNGLSSRSRGRGLGVGLQTPIDSSERLHVTPVGESTFFERGVTTTITKIIKNHFNGPWPTWRKVPNDVKELMFKKFQAIEMKRDGSFLEVFNWMNKHMADHSDFIDNKSKSTSKMFTFVLSQKYGEDSSSQLEFDPHAWTEAIGGMETTRTHIYGFGIRVPITALLSGTQSNTATSESARGPINSNATSPVIALEEKVNNLSENLGTIHDEILGEIREEIKNAMVKSMSEFTADMETMIMTNALSK
ncbi:Uncharacterized protein TCM_035414 [Theobroma cacao]|uniref:Uncharacterized protein n=1 Tax=Theobroma cacao TaxID=3641 RepID=A0A061FI52_THECC|nr:Uncharacterized protein TCM_035414 [Theobroma cacao]